MFGFASIRRHALGISPDETTFARRGFSATDRSAQEHLERVGRSFLEGYNTALAEPGPAELVGRLNDIHAVFRGFAFEGAAMALALLDLITPWNRRRLQAFCDHPAGDEHVYMLYVGAGWGVARVPWARRRFERCTRSYHPLYRWLALDGYGFHEGYFYTPQYVGRQRLPRGLSAHAQRVFDQGLGRSMWFSHGGDPGRIAGAIAGFPPRRQQDLWSGAGLGATYAGGVDQQRLEDLRDRAGRFAAHLAQGASFAAKARQRGGNPAPHTELACGVFCLMSADAAAAVSDDCLADLTADGAEPAYEIWRRRIRERLAAVEPAPPPGQTAVRVPS